MRIPDERVIERIRKILSLSDNNPSEGEAQAAMLKAQEMLAKYNLEMEAVMGSAEPEKHVVDEIVATERSWWVRQLGAIIGTNFRCTAYVFSGEGLYFIGLTEDVEIAATVLRFAIDQIRTDWRRFRDRYGIRGRAAGVMNDYILGFLAGLRAKFDEQVKRENWGLVLAQDEAVVRATLEKGLSKGPRTTIQRNRSLGAHSQGYFDGKNFSHSPSASKMLSG